MKNTNKNITLETINNECIWAVELDDGYGRHWVTGTAKQVEWAMESEDFSDCDLCANQPEHLRPFFEAYWNYQYGPERHGFTPIETFYEIWKEAA